jgi:hypothetical protein
MELNGPQFDWLNSPTVVKAIYECSCGRAHEKCAIYNGIIDDREALVEIKNNCASSAATKCRRQEEAERIRKQARDTHLAKEYAQSMMEWGRMAQIHHENILKVYGGEI